MGIVISYPLAGLTLAGLAMVINRLNVVYALVLTPLWLALALVLLLAAGLGMLLRTDEAPARPAEPRRIPRLAIITGKQGESGTIGPETSPALASRGASVWARAHPTIGTSMQNILLLIRNSFIAPWFTRISPSKDFPSAVDELIGEILLIMVSRTESVDWPTVMVSRLAPIMKDHLRHFRSVEHLASSDPSSTALSLPLPAQAHKALAGSSASFAASNQAVEEHLRSITSRILIQVIPDERRTVVIDTLLREIMLGAVIVPLFEMMCEADFWNRQIDERGGQYLKEQ